VVRVEACLDGACRDAQRLAPSGDLNRLEVPVIDGAAYQCFNLGGDLLGEERCEAPFFAASFEAADALSRRELHRRSLTSTSSLTVVLNLRYSAI